MARINLARILINAKKLTPEELDKAFLIQKRTGKTLKAVLIEKGFITEDELLSAFSYHLQIPFIDISKLQIDPKVTNWITEDIARKYSIFPLYEIGGILFIAVVEPLDILTLDNLHLLTKLEIKQVLSREKTILNFMDTYYLKLQSLPEILDYQGSLEIVRAKESLEAESMNLIIESRKEPIVKAVNLIINEAIAKRASDIHLEPTEDDLTVRYRIDGILHKVYSLPRKSQKGIAARIKILSNLDITKFYLPQDGRFPLVYQGRPIDFRVSSLPTIYGEKFVLRILEKTSSMVDLDVLGFSPQPLDLVKEAITKEHGMILFTGPTGSGKSTTLYAILTKLNIIKRHIVTIEDPVEYKMDGIGQTQVRSEIDLTFATALRGILRQSPDIIMIGEIRDTETADIAIKASLIGQLILSTLHTNDAISAFARLIDMGVERYLVVSSLILICAQRLCRRICPNCKEPVKTSPIHVLKELDLKVEQEAKFYYGKGCAGCYNTGYKGRVALLEALKVDDQIKGMVIREEPFGLIKDLVVKEKSLITLRQDGLNKALTGITTIEEVYRVTAQD